MHRDPAAERLPAGQLPARRRDRPGEHLDGLQRLAGLGHELQDGGGIDPARRAQEDGVRRPLGPCGRQQLRLHHHGRRALRGPFPGLAEAQPQREPVWRVGDSPTVPVGAGAGGGSVRAMARRAIGRARRRWGRRTRIHVPRVHRLGPRGRQLAPLRRPGRRRAGVELRDLDHLGPPRVLGAGDDRTTSTATSSWVATSSTSRATCSCTARTSTPAKASWRPASGRAG